MKNNLNNWMLNTPTSGMSLQHDGVYGLLSWRDMAFNSALDTFEFRHYVWALVLAIGVPLAVVS
jgi:hypothetical protein